MAGFGFRGVKSTRRRRWAPGSFPRSSRPRTPRRGSRRWRRARVPARGHVPEKLAEKPGWGHHVGLPPPRSATARASAAPPPPRRQAPRPRARQLRLRDAPVLAPQHILAGRAACPSSSLSAPSSVAGSSGDRASSRPQGPPGTKPFSGDSQGNRGTAHPSASRCVPSPCSGGTTPSFLF